MPVDYYDKILYPLQNKVFLAFRNSPFYLTGGTALSRGYYNHRYSDDLDYFVNDHPDFVRIIGIQIKKLEDIFKNVKVILKDLNFCRLFVGNGILKIEMANDVPAHIGKLIRHPILGTIDSRENILANKITAILDRAMPKDIVDLYFLLKNGINLKQALLNAESKAAGISPLLIAKILYEYNYELIDSEIKWINPIPHKLIKNFLKDVSISIVKGTI